MLIFKNIYHISKDYLDKIGIKIELRRSSTYLKFILLGFDND